MRDKERNQALVAARVGRNQYLCASCKLIFTRKEVQIDHIEPVTPITGWDSLDSFVTRLKVPIDKLQIICKTCHKTKSGAENETRRTSKRNKKNII
jgi:5-methylcytosine-specific restriction endonuclease McrA